MQRAEGVVAQRAVCGRARSLRLLILTASICGHVAEVLELEACRGRQLGDPCAMVGAMNTVRHGNCTALTAVNGSGANLTITLSCMLHGGHSDAATPGDSRTCQSQHGLLHTSGACCPRACGGRCGASNVSDQQCNVDYILRMSPTCGSPPCVVAGTQGSQGVNAQPIVVDDAGAFDPEVQAVALEDTAEGEASLWQLEGTVRWGGGGPPPGADSQSQQEPDSQTFVERVAKDTAALAFAASLLGLFVCCCCMTVFSMALRAKERLEPELEEEEEQAAALETFNSGAPLRPKKPRKRAPARRRAVEQEWEAPRPEPPPPPPCNDDTISSCSMSSRSQASSEVLARRDPVDELILDIDNHEPITIVDIWAPDFGLPAAAPEAPPAERSGARADAARTKQAVPAAAVPARRRAAQPANDRKSGLSRPRRKSKPCESDLPSARSGQEGDCPSVIIDIGGAEAAVVAKDGSVAAGRPGRRVSRASNAHCGKEGKPRRQRKVAAQQETGRCAVDGAAGPNSSPAAVAVAAGDGVVAAKPSEWRVAGPPQVFTEQQRAPPEKGKGPGHAGRQRRDGQLRAAAQVLPRATSNAGAADGDPAGGGAGAPTSETIPSPASTPEPATAGTTTASSSSGSDDAARSKWSQWSKWDSFEGDLSDALGHAEASGVAGRLPRGQVGPVSARTGRS